MNSLNKAASAIWGVVETAVDESTYVVTNCADNFCDSMRDMKNKIFYSKTIDQNVSRQYNGYVLVEEETDEKNNSNQPGVFEFITSLLESLYVDNGFQFNAF